MNNLALQMLNDFCIAYPDLEVPSYNNTHYYHPTRKSKIEHRDIQWIWPTFDDSCLFNYYSLVPIRRHVPINSHASRH